MAHVDPTRLMDIALGHEAPADDPVLRHLARCARCREELRRTALVVAAARGVQERDVPVAPPDRVWRRIAEGLAQPEATPAPQVGPPHGPPVPQPRTGRPPESAGSRRAGPAPPSGTGPAALRQRLRAVLRRVRGLGG
ncbi:hypothetical protein ABT026_04500 [Streptomyces sp. NPDC002734]|uniref:hypothetical protein n=1 Tax=Streptomyces sp. NPDC002734 TaxID=3154426 RepID=UPI003329B377